MVQSTVKYKVLPTDVKDENESDCEEDGDEEITIHFQSSQINLQRGKRRRDTYIRVMVAIILLGIVSGFIFYEWNGFWSGFEEHQDLSQQQESNETDKNTKDHHQDHNHHHNGEEDDADKDEDHNHHHDGEGDDADKVEDHNHHHDGEEDDDHDEDHNHHHDGEEDDDHDEDHDHHHHHDQQDDHHSHSHTHSEPLFHNAAVITESDICTRIGKELLQEQGNVVDAGIAALLCLGVVHPHTAGLGGVFSAILYNHTTRSFKAVHDTSQKLPAYGAPSLLHGLRLLHSNFGLLQWSRLFEGATKLAKDGFLIDRVLSKALETHKDKILQSKLCDLFCDRNGGVKSEGAHVINENLSELLQSVSLNALHFPENLTMKLAEDISEPERQAFLVAAQASGGEINDPHIVEKEKYTILSVHSQLPCTMVSNILDRVRNQTLSFQSNRDLNNAAASYNSLLNFLQELFSSSPTTLKEILTLNTTSSHVGALDSHGNFIVISTSLNSTWGSGQYLPSSGVILNDFTSNITQPYFSFPLVIKIKGEDDADDNADADKQENEMQFVAVTGGISALFQAAVMLRNIVDFELSAHETVSSPFLHIEQGEGDSLSGCMSAVTNGSVVSAMLSGRDGQVREVGECSNHCLSMLLQLKAEHVGVYGTPITEVHADGY